MADRQILRFSDVVTFTDVLMTVLYSNFPTEDQSQTMPSSFTNPPYIKVISTNSNRVVHVVSRTTTQVVFGVSGEIIGDDTPDNLSDISLDVEVVNRDSEAVTGPTPSTDFSSIVPEPISTPLSILRSHSKFPYDEYPYDRILSFCQDSRRLIDELSRYYSTEATLKTTPWSTPVYPGPFYDTEEGYDENDPPDKAFDAKNRVRCLGVTPASSGVYNDMYTITFTSATEFGIVGLIQGSMGTGNTATDFTAGNGQFSIDADAWSGTFWEGARFAFELSSWYRIIHQIGLSMALGELMLKAYGEESAEENKIGGRLVKYASAKIKALLKPFDNGGLRLPSFPARSLHPHALPYDVDFMGRNLTRVSSGNQDAHGYRGEEVDIFRYLIDEDY